MALFNVNTPTAGAGPTPSTYSYDPIAGMYNIWDPSQSSYVQSPTLNYPSTSLYPSSTGSGGTSTGSASTGGQTIDLSALEGLFPSSNSSSNSSSSTTLPSWALQAIQDYMGNSFGTNTQGLQTALSKLAAAPDLIESTRKSMINQGQTALNTSLQTALQPSISNLASKGVINSSTASGVMGTILNNLQNIFANQAAGANTWAGNALVNNLGTNVTAYQNQLAQLASLLNAAKQSTSTSTSSGQSSDPLAPYTLMMPYLI